MKTVVAKGHFAADSFIVRAPQMRNLARVFAGMMRLAIGHSRFMYDGTLIATVISSSCG